MLLQVCYCERNRKKFQALENIAKKVLPHQAAAIETVVAEYLQKWEARNNADLTNEKWKARNDAALTDEKWETSDNADEKWKASDNATLTDENTVQNNQTPLSSSEKSSQSLDEGSETTSTQN